MPDNRKIQIYRGRRGLLSRNQYRARAMRSGRVVWSTPEGYNNKQDLKDVCESFMPGVRIEDTTV